MRRLFVQRFWRFLALLAMTLAFPAAVLFLWEPEHLTWAHNAYGMAKVGAWDGGHGFVAMVAYWFFELKGRSLVSMAMLCAWIGCAWWWVRNDGN